MGNTNLVGEKAYYFNEKNMLGEGTFAKVLKVKHKVSNEVFAAKIFKMEYKVMDKLQELGYERELEILKTTNHPFVIKYIEEFVYKESKFCIIT